MKAVSGCLGLLLIIASVLLGAYTLIIIPISNFASGSIGAQNAMILPNLVIGVVMLIFGCVMVAVSGNGDGGASSPTARDALGQPLPWTISEQEARMHPGQKLTKDRTWTPLTYEDKRQQAYDDLLRGRPD